MPWSSDALPDLLSDAPFSAAALKAAVRAADDFLYGEAGKSKWDAAFGERLFRTAAQHHPWISREAFKSLSMVGQHINWHDGLEL